MSQPPLVRSLPDVAVRTVEIPDGFAHERALIDELSEYAARRRALGEVVPDPEAPQPSAMMRVLYLIDSLDPRCPDCGAAAVVSVVRNPADSQRGWRLACSSMTPTHPETCIYVSALNGAVAATTIVPRLSELLTTYGWMRSAAPTGLVTTTTAHDLVRAFPKLLAIDDRPPRQLDRRLPVGAKVARSRESGPGISQSPVRVEIERRRKPTWYWDPEGGE